MSRRAVVLGHTGSISFDAIRWLHDVGAGYVQIDADGAVLASFGPLGRDRPSLRRAQARALDGPDGLAAAVDLIGRKLEGQLRTLEFLDCDRVAREEASGAIETSLTALPEARDRAQLRTLEAQAAAGYWGAWRDLPVRFARRDLSRIPGHWTSFGSRTSPLTGGPRLATNPANAMLNYLYALLEGEASIAARKVGLDPGPVGLPAWRVPNRKPQLHGAPPAWPRWRPTGRPVGSRRSDNPPETTSGNARSS